MAFSLDTYKARVARVRFDDLDFGSFRRDRLDPAALRCIRYMHDVEFHTICYLRDLLLTPAHSDPEVTGFLSMWVYEELWHGEALGAVLAAHDEPHGEQRVARLRTHLGWRDRLRPLVMTAGGWAVGDDMVAVQMAWGALNEATTQAGYSVLSRRAGHPVLSELLSRIMRQEGLHLDFYTTQAKARLAASARARRVVRQALRHLWRPVGSGVMPAEETDFIVQYVLGGEAGAKEAARLDRRIDRLPGLSGLELVSRTASARSAGRRSFTKAAA
jgi:hypothetical protein